MVDIIKLRELGFDVDCLSVPEDDSGERMVHHMLKGYKKFNSDYVHLLADHAHHILGVDDKEIFREDLLQKTKDQEKDEALHCALSIMSIHHRKRHHEENGHGVSFPEAHRVVISFLKDSTPEKVQEMHDRFPHVTKEILADIAHDSVQEEQSA
jgi:hypothetical protein